MPVRRKYRVQKTINRKRKKSFLSWKGFWGMLNFKPKKKLISKGSSPSVFKQLFRKKRRKKIKGKKVKRIFKLIFKLTFLMFVTGVLTVAGVFVYFSKDIPDPDKISDRSVAQSTKIYDRTGEHLLYEIHGEEKRTVVALDQISEHLINATIATEDHDFYKHYGIDFRGIARAIWKDVRSGEKLQGGSTITQQLIKNSILTSERTFTRKIKEIILAIETEQKFSKDEIIEMYLNQIPYGSNAYGIEAAAQTFFEKSSKDLNVSESALLAALPNATTYYSPYGAHPDALEFRYKYIIDRMRREKYISDEEAEEAKKIEILKKVKPFKEEIDAPHFVMYVKQKLVDEFGEEKIEKGGLKVYTTLHYEMQLIAEDAVKKGAEKNSEKYNARNAALVAIDPKTGQILSMVGSKDYFNIEEDGNVNVTISNRQPGSSFKPFIYAAAFKKGYTPDTILFDVETNFGKDGSGKEFRPQNYNFRFSGPVTMKNALARSLNIPAVKTLYLSGIKESVQTAHDLGITTLNNPEKYGLSLVLGTGEVKLLDITSAYSVFANDGKRNLANSILKIEDSDGSILKEFENNSKQVLDVEVARNITDVLSDNIARTPTFGSKSMLQLGKRPVAAKTGTTNDYKDGWTIGYTPSLAAGVWAGNNRGEKMKNAGGIKAAAPIWNDFMSRVLALDPIEKFQKPKPIEAKKAILNGSYKNEIIVKIDKACGDKLATELTPENQIEERKYYDVHNLLYYVNKDDPQGDYPKESDIDSMFGNWESPVLKWAEEEMGKKDGEENNGESQETEDNKINTKPPTEICHLRVNENTPILDIISPKNNQIIKESKMMIEAEAFANLDIKQIEFYFDDVLVGIDKVSPYDIVYKIPSGTEDGMHNITVRAYDKVENSVEKKISIVLSGNLFLYLKPIVGADFPFVLNAVSSSGKIESVSFYYQLDSVYDSDMKLIEKPGSKKKIGEAKFSVPGEENLFQILWEEDKEYFIAGKYKISAVMKIDDGKTYQSNIRYLEIK